MDSTRALDEASIVTSVSEAALWRRDYRVVIRKESRKSGNGKGIQKTISSDQSRRQ